MKPRTCPRLPAVTCPHCNTRAKGRSSNALTILYREIYYRCDNDACGCQFVVGMETLRILRPSMTPNPDVFLPTSSRPRPANDDGPVTPPPAANDDFMNDTA